MRNTTMASLDQTYEEFRRHMEIAPIQFRRRYGGDLDELRSIAGQAFAEACRSHRPERGTLRKRVRYVVWNRMLEQCRRGERRRRHHGRVNMVAVPDRSCFNLHTFLGELSKDAAEAIQLILEAPAEIADALGSADRIETRRALVADFLLGLGWAAGRVISTFKEIGEALR